MALLEVADGHSHMVDGSEQRLVGTAGRRVCLRRPRPRPTAPMRCDASKDPLSVESRSAHIVAGREVAGVATEVGVDRLPVEGLGYMDGPLTGVRLLP